MDDRLENYNQPFKSAPKKIKAFLNRQRWNQALIFFFFILLSLGFWMLQSLQQDYEIELSFPVRYKNVPPEMVFTPQLPKQIRVKVKDKGSVLLNYTFGRQFIPIDIEFKDLNPAGGEFKVPAKTIQSDILKQLLSTTVVEGTDPAGLTLKYAPRAKKEIPIVFDGEIVPEAGFFLADSVALTPGKAEVYASKAILDTLKQIRTEYIRIDQVNKTVTRKVNLRKIEGVTFVPETVMLTAAVEEYTEKTLLVPVFCPDLPTDLILRTFPPKIKVTCHIPLSRFKDLTDSDIRLEVKFAELEQNLTGYAPIHIVKKPGWVKNLSLSPDKVEFILEQNPIAP